ncbi:NAD(P)/FAD-dependent oxidoreductase [Pseudomonas canadensis]|uniref:NAD(P)/FAD-dependent oxidoreductase n=1 Tax=Pseudomonas canadensis TaxID=915099 RepID=UPI0030CFEF90
MKHKIVIVGGGAGGLELATKLGKRFGKSDKASITLVDTNLTHVWKPLLHEVAAGALSSATEELNYHAQAKWNHFSFELGTMEGLDRKAKTLSLAAVMDEDDKPLIAPRTLCYDTLIVAVGSNSNDFGITGAREHAVFLDTRKQADFFHRKLLNAYLSSTRHQDATGAISIAIVGAGATGVELAAELRHAAEELFSYGLGQVKPDNLKITVIEAGPRILPGLPERISNSVLKQLTHLGVNVLVNAAVSGIDETGLTTREGQRIKSDLKVWAAGIKASLFLKDLDGLETNNINQLVVGSTLQTTRDESIFAFGDCAACFDPHTGRNVPPRAQAAHQQASTLVKSMQARILDKPLPTFSYKDYGSLVSLSRFSAVGNLMGGMKLEGHLARYFYMSLYQMHQVALYGGLKTGLSVVGGFLRRRIKPALKLH